jgi:RNA polymerase sigma-70 factor (ECF subfamily)
MLMTTDTVLVQRAARGDREAFSAVYEESFRCVYAFALRHLRKRRPAEALTERVLVRVFTELGGYQGEVPFAAWLLAIAKQVMAPRRRTRTARAPLAHTPG